MAETHKLLTAVESDLEEFQRRVAEEAENRPEMAEALRQARAHVAAPSVGEVLTDLRREGERLQ